MKKFLVSALVFAVQVQVHAFSPNDFLSQAKAVAQRKIAKPDSSRGLFGPDKCTDFAGVWKGTCTQTSPEGDKTSDETVTITQNKCISLQINNQSPMNLGSVRSEATSDTFLWSDAMMFPDWNQEATEVIFKILLMYKMTIPTGQQATLNGGGRMSIQNDKLLVDFAFQDTKSHCEYQKVP